jgi:hypothetical protein
MKKQDFLGAELEHEIAKGIALGDLDPIHLKAFETTETDLKVVEKICGKKTFKLN